MTRTDRSTIKARVERLLVQAQETPCRVFRETINGRNVCCMIHPASKTTHWAVDGRSLRNKPLSTVLLYVGG